MGGTKLGGQKAAATNKRIYGKDFYAKIGAMGGREGHTGGFYANRKLASIAGRKGGKVSQRYDTAPEKKIPLEVRQARADFQDGFVPKNASPQEKSWLRSKLKV